MLNLHLSHLKSYRVKLSVKVSFYSFRFCLHSFVLGGDLRLHLELPHVIPHSLDLVKLLVQLVGLFVRFKELVSSKRSDLPQLGLTHNGKLRELQTVHAVDSTTGVFKFR